jgi:Spy/CpxP family protein refolding chaperone
MPRKLFLFLVALPIIAGGLVAQSEAQESKVPFADNIIGTLANPNMAKELDLLDEQKEIMEGLMKEFGQLQHSVGSDMKERWLAAGDEDRKELEKEYWGRIEEGRLSIVGQMKDNLLPHQIDRVEQLSAQRMMLEGKGRDSAGLLSDQMLSYLNITDKQKQRIENKSRELKKEVTKKIQKILEEAKQELLSELDAEQKRKYEKLLGDPVTNDNDDSPVRDKKYRRGGKM